MGAPAEPSATGSVESYLQATRLAQDRIAEVDAAITALKADNEAYRASVEADLARKFDDRRGRLLLSSVQTLESLDEAVQAARAGGASDALLQGVMLVRTQLYRLLTEEGLQRISVLGLPFDTRTSVIAGRTPVDEESQDGLVVQEVRSGQQLDGRVVRKARVVVGRYEPEAVPEAPEPVSGPRPVLRTDEEEYPTLIGVPAELSLPPGLVAGEGSPDATLIGSPPSAEAEPEALAPVEHVEEPTAVLAPIVPPEEATMIVRAPLVSPATPAEEPALPTAPGLPELESEYANADPSATMPFLRLRRKPPVAAAAVPSPAPPPPEEATMISAVPFAPEAPATEAETPEATAAMPAVTQAMPTVTEPAAVEATRAIPIVTPPPVAPPAPPAPPTPPPAVWTRPEPRPSAPSPAPPPPPASPAPVTPPPVAAASMAVEEERTPAARRPRRGLYIALALGIALLLVIFLIEVRLLLRPTPRASPTAAEAPAPAATAPPLVAEGPPVTAAPPATVALPPATLAEPPATTAPPPTMIARPTPATPAAATPRPAPSPVRPVLSPGTAAAPTPVAPATVAPPPNPAVALLAQADRAAAAENLDEAVRLYDQALQVDPKNSDAAAGRLRAMIARDARRTFTTAPTRVETASSGKGLSGFEGVKVTKAPKHSGKIEFEVSPRIPLPGEPYTVAVHLANTGDKGFKVASLNVVTTVNGSAATQTVAPRAREVSEGRRALVAEVPGVWREGTTTWSMSVTLAAPGGETFRSQLTWR